MTGDTPLVYIRPGADGVTLRHFALIFDTTNDCDKSTAEAILVSGNHDQVLGNRIRTTGPDTNFATCGYFIGIGVGLQSGPTTSTTSVASLASIAPAGSPPISATVGWNTVRDFQFAGMIVVGPQTTATTKRNSIHYGHQGATSCTTPVTAATALPGPRSRGAITPSGIVTCLSIGIIYSDLAGGRIHDNVVMSDFELVGTTSPSGTSQPLQPLLYGGILNGFLGSGGSVNITDNTVQFAVAGIGSGPNTGPVLIAGNTVSFTLDFGIGLIGGSTSTAVKQNKVAQSGGLFAADTAIGNIFRSNTVTNGGCEDDTIGVDTGGTANHWVNDIGDTSSPVGICTPAP